MKINTNFLKLKPSYLFMEIAKRVNKYKEQHPDNKIIRMGIGYVTRPLAPSVVEAMVAGAREQGEASTFRGYDDGGVGYDFLRNAIADYYKDELGASIAADDIFISDGAKSDCGNIGDIFSADNKVMITDPVYTVYLDTNIMAGREIVYINSDGSNGFAAMPPEGKCTADIIYLCSPNNPSGSVYTKAQLKIWLDYAADNNALIIYDSAYEAFITDPDLTRSIYTIEGAENHAIEICSLSKTAGFTGTRLGYTIVPTALKFDSGESVKALWTRRQNSKFNGVSYPIQKAAAAVFTKQGQTEVKQSIRYYLDNAKLIMSALDELNIPYTGGKHSPYVWFKCDGGDSWATFDLLLNEAEVVGTPGAGFGKNGDGWLRLTAFNTRENTAEAMARLKRVLGKQG